MRKMSFQLSVGKSVEKSLKGDEESYLSLWKELNLKHKNNGILEHGGSKRVVKEFTPSYLDDMYVK